MAQLILENLYKTFIVNRKIESNQANVLKGINLTVAPGEFMVLVGPSGCGKSTLLRLIAGLEEVSAGKIWIGDRLVNELPAKARDIAMVFQNYALYPHLKVYDNIAFGLRRMNFSGQKKTAAMWRDRFLMGISSKLPSPLQYLSAEEKKIKRQVQGVARLLQIETLLDRFPKQLSGGQKQRVALGRAIARNPQVFLMDEPLSNLDAKLRTQTRAELVKLQKQLGITTIYVTHDQTEAMTMGDRIAVMNEGEIQQVSTPLEIYDQPANKFVAEFIGSPPMNFIPVEFQPPHSVVHPLFSLTLPSLWQVPLQNYHRAKVLLGIRPEHFQLSQKESSNSIPVIVDLVETLGNEILLDVHLEVQPFTSLHLRISPDYKIKNGEKLWVSINLEKITLFDFATGMNLH